jgi:hypothetical protein
MTQPKTYDIKSLAIWSPKTAYGMIVGVPRVPFIADIPLQFSASTVNAPPVDGNLNNNLTQDTVIERISYNLWQPNSFPGSPLQSTYVNQLKQSGATGVGIQMAVYGGPKYDVTSSSYTDLGNLADVFGVTWPEGWPLQRQSNIKVSAILTQTPVSVPFNVTLTFLGWNFLSKELDDMSDAECRSRLRKIGIETPDISILLKP